MTEERERREWETEGALPVGSVEKGDRGGYGVVVVAVVLVLVVAMMVWVRAEVLALLRDVRDRGNKGSR